MKKPTMVIISDDIRRDLHDPLKYFTKINVIHLYRKSRYQDMKDDEYTNSMKYNDTKDLFEKLKNIKPDIIQGPEPYASRSALKNCITLLKYHKAFKAPYIFPVFENRPPKIKFGFFIGLIMKWFLYIYASSATKIISLNKGATENLLSAGIDKSKITHLCWGTWGVDPNEFKPDSKYNNQKSKNNEIILFIGKIEKQKGILDLYQSFIQLKKKIENLELWIIGTGALIEKIKNQPGVRYLGIIKNQDIPQYLQKATVTSVPAKTTKIWAEQVGMVNIQSLACGTPIVSTHSGAIPEYTPDGVGGILVEEGNILQLTKALEKILTDNLLYNKYSQNGLKLVQEKYLAKDNIKKAEEMIIEILNKSK